MLWITYIIELCGKPLEAINAKPFLHSQVSY